MLIEEAVLKVRLFGWSSMRRKKTEQCLIFRHLAADQPLPAATECVKGMTVDEATKIKNTEIANHLNFPPVKLHCSILAENAIKAAIKD